MPIFDSYGIHDMTFYDPCNSSNR